MTDDEVRDALAFLERTRDTVLTNARIGKAETVADVGAGTGLLTIGAVECVGRNGDVLAFDVSADALAELRRLCAAPNVAYLIGSADVLPLPGESVDVVVTRSVLIYVRDKSEAAREFFRVLRPGGRCSLFEPINSRATRLWDAVDFGDLRDRVIADFALEWPPDDPIHNFDERDLARDFEAAGFEAVSLDLDDFVQDLSPDQLLNAVGAPGHRSLLERWRAAFSPDEVRELVRAVRTAGTVTTRLTRLFLAGVKA
jgi:arsenite methyltransferase